MMKKTLTVFTPTYNRAHLLPRLYESLCRQTCGDFLWLVIDDGSSDHTRELVGYWINENKIEIRYHHKKNGGMHTGHNAAYRLIDTELNVCIDSDDYMPDDGVEKILNKWKNIADKDEIAGIIGLDADADGNVIGSRIPESLVKGSLTDLYLKYGVKGDKKIILKSSLVSRYPPYPEYAGEKLVPLGVLYRMMGKDFAFVYTNDIYCIVEYQQEGSSSTILRQYQQSPLGFAYARKVYIRDSEDTRELLKNYIHLVSSAIFAGKPSVAFSGVNPWLSVLMLPFGLLLNLYIRIKTRK